MATPGAPQDEGYTPMEAGDLTLHVKYEWFSGSCRLERAAAALVLPRLIRVVPGRRGALRADFFLATEA